MKTETYAVVGVDFEIHDCRCWNVAAAPSSS